MLLIIALGSLGFFAWLVSLATRVLVPKGWPLAVAAVVGNSATIVAMTRCTVPGSFAGLLVAGGLCGGEFWAAVGGQLYVLAPAAGAPRRRRLASSQITGLFTLLGVTAFATIVTLGLLIAQAGDWQRLVVLLTPLSVLAALAAMPALAAGLTAMRAAERQNTGALSPGGNVRGPGGRHGHGGRLGARLAAARLDHRRRYAGRRGAGRGSLPLAVPLLHAGVIACAALAWVTAFHLATGQLPLSGDRPH